MTHTYLRGCSWAFKGYGWTWKCWIFFGPQGLRARNKCRVTTTHVRAPRYNASNLTSIVDVIDFITCVFIAL